MSNNVVVVGSLSVDFVMQVPRRPQKGETIAGSDFSTFVGGKGNNQALAAARAGASVAIVGRVGSDSYGDRIEDRLKENHVRTDYLFRDKEVGTGIANIYVDPEGDNSIVIVPQANGRLGEENIQAAAEAISSAHILLMQMEIPSDTIAFAARLARQSGVLVALNPAPAPPSGKLAGQILGSVDLLIPNQTEAELLTGIKIRDRQTACEAARALKALGPKQVIITLGEQGALLLGSDDAEFVPSYAVDAVDTTAAGDAFCGALAAALAAGKTLADAVALGCAAGALACTVRGAEPSLPGKEAIEALARYCPDKHHI